MKTLNLFGTVAVVCGLISACAVPSHQVPSVSEQESREAATKITAAPSLLPTTRTAIDNERISRKAMARLQPAANHVCLAAGQTQCWFRMQFSPQADFSAASYHNIIFMYNGLAQYLETEDEFALIIAHEMGHHIGDHFNEDAQNRAIGALIGGVLFGAAAYASGVYDNSYDFQRDYTLITQIAAQLGNISYSKAQEKEADYLASYIMTKARYNPRAAGSVWAKLTKATGHVETALLDTHPSGPDRLAAWEKSVEEVRYSPDLMPNPVGTGEERKLQVARSFGAPSSLPTSGGYQVATASTSISPSLTTVSNSKAFGLAGSPKIMKWKGLGPVDKCGGRWALKMKSVGQDLEGTFWWNTVEYLLLGQLEPGGARGNVIATKTHGNKQGRAPENFEISFQFAHLDAVGVYATVGEKFGCQAEMKLARTR